MKLLLFTAAAILSVASYAHADGRFERTLNVSSTPDLYVNTGSGNIVIRAGGGNQIHVVAHIHSGWSLFSGSGGDDSMIRHIEQNPPIQQDGNAVRIGEANTHGSNNISIDYDITAPAGAALTLHTGSGDVTSDGVGRTLTASSGSGNLRLHGVAGSANLQTGSGDITLDAQAAGNIKAHTGSGNIHIHGLNGSLSARAGSGDIDAEGHLCGAADLTTGSGNVRLHLGNDARFNLEAVTGSGDIHIRYPGAPQQDEHTRHHMTAPINGGGPPLQVRTGSGNVEIAS